MINQCRPLMIDLCDCHQSFHASRINERVMQKMSFYFNEREVPKPENADAKEVFSFFGLAVYSAQVFEQGVLNLLVALNRVDLKIVTQEKIDSFYESYSTSTLGQLLRATRELHPFNDDRPFSLFARDFD